MLNSLFSKSVNKLRGQLEPKRVLNEFNASSAMIGGCKITSLYPLKTHGLAKSGNISLGGRYNGRRVKVSSMFTSEQVEFRQKIAKLSNHIALPELVAFEDQVIVEEWILGISPTSSDRTHKLRIESVILDFVFGDDRYQFSKIDQCNFDYLEYLLNRVSMWHFMEGVSRFVARWEEQFELVQSQLRLALSNPDLRFDNFVIEKDTDRIFLIDNEFLHVGMGGFMDLFNSSVSNEYNKFNVSEDLNVFYKNTVKLRKFGSELITGHPERIKPSMLEWEDE